MSTIGQLLKLLFARVCAEKRMFVMTIMATWARPHGRTTLPGPASCHGREPIGFLRLCVLSLAAATADLGYY
jgi:hypothetical protein